MPEQSAMHLLRQWRLARWPARIAWSLAGTLALCGIPAAAFAQSVPPALRACAAETDAGQRLDCYDQEMARLLGPAKQPAAAATKPDVPMNAAPAAGPSVTRTQPSTAEPAPAQSAATTQASSATPAQYAAPAPASSAAQAPAAAATSAVAPATGVTSASHRSSWKNILSGGPSWHLTAHVASVDRSPDTMVLHLDNGQTWRQLAHTSGDLSLRAGDSVTIEKHFGSYYLSSQYVSNMQVRQELQQSQ